MNSTALFIKQHRDEFAPNPNVRENVHYLMPNGAIITILSARVMYANEKYSASVIFNTANSNASEVSTESTKRTEYLSTAAFVVTGEPSVMATRMLRKSFPGVPPYLTTRYT